MAWTAPKTWVEELLTPADMNTYMRDNQNYLKDTEEAHEAATIVHGATGAVVGTTNVQTLTNKTLDWEAIAAFLHQGKLVPILVPHLVAAVTGTGSSGTSWQERFTDTGANAGSTARLHMGALGLQDGASQSYIPWNKKMVIVFPIEVSGGNAAFISYVGLTEANAYGDLAAPGIGIKAANLDLWGESYGTSRDAIDLSAAIVANQTSWVAIVHDPTVPSIEWYMNWVLKNTQTTSGKIPQAAGVAAGYYVASQGNNAAAVNYRMISMPGIYIAVEA